MKNLTALELHHLLKEFQILINSKLDKIYHPSKKELILQFHIPNMGQKLLHVVVPNAIYFTAAKQEAKEPSQFCAFLRKNLTNAKLLEIKQLAFERILEFVFQAKDEKFSLIFELFSKGNIILTKENQIMIALEYQKWAERTIRPKEAYKYPEREYNFLTITAKELREFLKKTKKESIVTAIAIELGLGGIYAEECCHLSEINKTKKPAELSEKEINSLWNAFQQLKTKKLNPRIILKDTEILDIVPFELQIYKNLKQEQKNTYSEALDEYFSKHFIAPEKAAEKEKYQKQLEKLQRIIQEQQETIKNLEKEEQEAKSKAEYIYQNYTKIAEILENLKGKPWDEIKSIKCVKEANPKEKTVILEI